VIMHRMLKNAMIIPQRATFESLSNRCVYVVDKERVAHQREIVIQNESEGLFVTNKGVDVGEVMVLEGVRRIRDGEKVEFQNQRPKK
jgi:membrane fusion protein (multidrug efflux system)